MHQKLVLTVICISLFGGLCFGVAPVATVNVTTNTVQVLEPAPIIATLPASTPTPDPTNTVPQVVDSQALLSSLTPDERIARLENQVQYLSTYTTQVQNLSTQVSILRGQVEDLTHQMGLLQKQVVLLSQNNIAQPTATTTTSTTPAAAVPPAPAETTTSTTVAAPATSAANVSPQEQTAFNNAYTLLTQKQYDQATTAFNNFLKKYPKSTLAADAHFWLGDLYLAEGQPDNASQEYRAVISSQNAAKRPDAMVKLGTILLAYGDNTNAKKLFQTVISQYPNTPAAAQAKTRLQGISGS